MQMGGSLVPPGPRTGTRKDRHHCLTATPHMLSVFLRNLLFSIVVPGAGAVWLPWWILTRFDPAASPAFWPAVAVIALGAALYLWCVWLFGRSGAALPAPGTRPGAWSPPARTGGCATRSTWPRWWSYWARRGC